MKFVPVTKLDEKRNEATSKKLTMTSYQKLRRHCIFSDLWPIYSHPEAGFRRHGLQNLHFH